MRTASFFSYTGTGRISIARYPPRGTPAGFRIYKPLAPGHWFNKVTEVEYRKLYSAQLASLEPLIVVEELQEMAEGVEPVLLCYERMADVNAGRTFCHRHMVAEWLKDRLDLDVQEIGAPT